MIVSQSNYLSLLVVGDTWLANPALPEDIHKEAVPGNIGRAEHFLSVLRRFVQYLKREIAGRKC